MSAKPMIRKCLGTCAGTLPKGATRAEKKAHGVAREMTVTPDTKHGGVDVTCSECGWYYGWLGGIL